MVYHDPSPKFASRIARSKLSTLPQGEGRNMRINLKSLIGLSPTELKAALIAAGVPEKSVPMRVRQLWNWIYVHGARDFAAMTNLAKDFRSAMDARFTLARPGIVTEQISNDGTRKW